MQYKTKQSPRETENKMKAQNTLGIYNSAIADRKSNTLHDLYIPEADKFAHYFPRTFAGGVTEYDMYTFALEHRMNILLFGEAGVGKTTSAEWIASKLGLPYAEIPSNSAMDYSQVVGTLLPNTETGILEWRDGTALRVIREGGVLLIGEINTLAKNVSQFLMSLLDDRRHVTIMENGGEVVQAHENLIIIADMNPNYRGTSLLNEAWKDRFEIKVEFDYDRAIESKFIKSGALLDLAYGMRQSSRGIDAKVEGSSSTIFDTPISPRILKTFEKLATKLNYDFAVSNMVNAFDIEERPSVKMMLEGAEYNIKSDLGLDTADIVTEHENA
jgi:hypothetical protein